MRKTDDSDARFLAIKTNITPCTFPDQNTDCISCTLKNKFISVKHQSINDTKELQNG